MASNKKDVKATTPAESKEGKDKDKEKEKKEKLPVVVPSPEFNLHEYISRYDGQTKITRLRFIADRYEEKQVEAYKMAIDALKKTKNTTLYRKTLETVGEKLPTVFTVDSAWADSVDKKAQALEDELNNLLNGYKTNLLHNKIRTGFNALGNFHYERGDYNAALRDYIRTQDYCKSPDNIIEMCMNIVKVSVALNNFTHVLNYIGKAEQTQGIDDKKITVAQLKATAGLAHIENKKYRSAAKKFIETSFDLGNQFNEVIAPQDIAVYGTLCALAEFDRKELKTEVLDNANFKNYLELVPHVGQLLTDFYNSNYAPCLAYLSILKNDLQLDIHLHDHINNLYEKIRNKALVQYFSPYTSVDLNKMADAFKVDVAALEKELSKLIMEDLISARIDSHNKRLYARKTQERRETFDKTLTMGTEFQTNTRAMLIRINLIRNNMLVKPQKATEKDRRDKRK